MAQKIYIVEGRQFRTESDYARAQRDKEIIDTLRREVNLNDKKQLELLIRALKSGKYKFSTMVGQDFIDELEELQRNPASGKRSLQAKAVDGEASGNKKSGGAAKNSNNGKKTKVAKSVTSTKKVKSTKKKTESLKKSKPVYDEKQMQAFVEEELRKREQRRKWMIAICASLAVLCLGYFGIYNYYVYRTEQSYQQMADLKDKYASIAASSAVNSGSEPEGPLYTLDSPTQENKEILEKYKNLFNQNKKLIGWVKIADTNIDYPVMQTSDNEYYLDHNLNQEYDKNGSIFMDKDCDVLKPSTNFILYGHHMKSGKMFGKLHLYESEEYYKKHPYIQFDTIYEEGLYEIMYVFRSRVYGETEIVFKYYQFIDADSEQEFNSYMEEMASMSFYDTGVTARFGDQLLTLSTCDYEETNGRFVVVAKKIAKE